MSYFFGWKPDVPDFRDFKFSIPDLALKPVPEFFDLSSDKNQPPIYNQFNLGSCTAQAIAAAFHFERLDATQSPDFIPSRLFIYYNERVLEGTVKYDAGAYLRDGLKTLSKQGVCPESVWTYDISKFAKKPTAKAYSQALKYNGIAYSRVGRNLNLFKRAIFERNLIVLGIAVYESFLTPEVASSGIVPIPLRSESLMGGHAICLVGYSDEKQSFIARNSWGTTWGKGGFFFLPYEFIENDNLSDDFWIITKSRN